MKKPSLHKLLRITAIVLLLLVAFNALAAGYSFITDPTGKGLGFTTTYLKDSAPFKNYLIPGIVLFAVVGVLSLIVTGFIIMKTSRYALLVVFQGSVLVGWIAVQLTMVKAFHPLHLVIAAIGFVLIFIRVVLLKKPALQW